jgi:hypothetical protein
MPPVGDDPVARRRRGDHTIIIGIRPERPSSIVAPDGDGGQQPQGRSGAIAAAPNRIERKWNRRRIACGGPQRVALSTSCARVNG